MGRKAKVPVSGTGGNKIVPTSQIGHGAETPYSYSDVRWDVLRRLGYDGIPDFNDARTGR